MSVVLPRRVRNTGANCAPLSHVGLSAAVSCEPVLAIELGGVKVTACAVAPTPPTKIVRPFTSIDAGARGKLGAVHVATGAPGVAPCRSNTLTTPLFGFCVVVSMLPAYR